MRSRRTAAALAIATLAVTACGGKSSVNSIGSTTTAAGATFAPAPEGLANVVQVPVSGSEHVNGKVTYPTVPPAGGPHNSAWQNCGFYSVTVTPERAVHSLEHGAVWITYRSSIDAGAKAQLSALAKSSDYVLISPLDDQPGALSAAAWGRLLRLDTYDANALTQFVKTYAKTGPTVPEPGAPCSGAVGAPPDRPNQS